VTRVTTEPPGSKAVGWDQVAVAPGGSVDKASVTGELNPFRPVAIKSKVAAPPAGIDADGPMLRVKSGAPPVAIVSSNVTDLVGDVTPQQTGLPMIPVIVIGYVPTVIDAGTVIVSAAVALPDSAVGITDTVRPNSNPETVKLEIDPTNPYSATAANVTVADCPGAIVN
jgi:hypothetical protein